MDLLDTVRAWIDDDPDPTSRQELTELVERNALDELAERFSGRLQFGTAGLRGPLGAGPMRMNRAIVRRAAAGLAAHLLATVPDARERGVTIGYDARHGSHDFALDTAQVMSGAGIRALLLPGPCPTPVLAFSITHLGAAAGVMVTASHNPPADNGYKVYLGDGAQIVPPTDTEISAAIDAVGAVRMLTLTDERVEHVGDDVVAAYVEAARQVTFTPERDVRIAYTPMHGVGRDTFVRAMAAAGFTTPAVVDRQGEPDPDFPTVAFPNPEEPGAMDLLLELAASGEFDLAIANDPDADRLAVAIPAADGRWRALRGDEVGWLLADHVLRHTEGDDRLVVTTIVSSTLLGQMAKARGVRYDETLTGFKWIARAALDTAGARFVFGYEQALGYLVGTVTMDKDGIVAGLVMAEVAALAKKDGVTLQQRLDAITAEFGEHLTAERSLRMQPPEQAAAMERLRADPPTELAGRSVREVIDRRDGNVVLIELEGGGRVLVRPSGTEPKVKCYAELVGHDPAGLLDAIASRLS